jgi:hypothetical protein
MLALEENIRSVLLTCCIAVGEAWLDEFMKRICSQGEPPNYLGLHYYGPDGNATIQYIERM